MEAPSTALDVNDGAISVIHFSCIPPLRVNWSIVLIFNYVCTWVTLLMNFSKVGFTKVCCQGGGALVLTRLSTTASKEWNHVLNQNQTSKFPLLKASPGLQYLTCIQPDNPSLAHTGCSKAMSGLKRSPNESSCPFGASGTLLGIRQKSKTLP